jgi:molybdopterin-synthase adenylyltransferase
MGFDEEMKRIPEFLHQRARGDLLPWKDQAEAAASFGVSVAVVERIALENDLLPARYQRNRQMISCGQQLQLFNSVVAVVGCGGLGGYILEELTRLGVGRLIAIDPDVFEEHNINRQLLSSLSVLGRAKVEIAAERVREVNPAVTLDPVAEALDGHNGSRLLKGAHIAVDGLDNIPSRLELAEACRDVGIPLVHGAIAGWYGQVATQFPGERSLDSLYQGGTASRGIEKGLGNPSFTPAVVASLQVAEVCKVVLGEGKPLRGRTLAIDLREMEIMELVLGGGLLAGKMATGNRES